MKRIADCIRVPGVRELRLAIYTWFAGSLIASLIMYAFYAFFTGFSGSPLSADGTYYFWLPTFINDLSNNYPGSMAALAVSAAIAVFAVWLVSVFVSGGVYSLLAAGERISILLFLSSAAQNFTLMLRVFLANIPNFLAASAVPGILFYIHYRKQSVTLDESVMAFFICGWGALTAFIFIYSAAVYDLSRIIAIKEKQGVFASLKMGIGAVFSRKGRVFSIFAAYLIFVAILSLVYSGIAGIFKSPPPAVIIIALQQVFLFLRYEMKIMLMGAEVEICAGEQP